MSITKFEPNAPVRVALKFSTGKHVNGTYGEQVMYSFADGSIGYVPIIVEKKLNELNVKPGQLVEICKAKTNGKTEWQVSRVEPRKPQAAAQLLNGAPSLDGIPDGAENPVRRQNGNGSGLADDPALQTQLEFAFKTVLRAVTVAEKYSEEIGHPVRFDKDDVRLLATTLVINARRNAA